MSLNLFIFNIYYNCTFNFRVQKPEFRGYGILPRRVGEQSPYCINWILNEGMEIVIGSTGRRTDNKLSRLCKSELAKDYINLCHATDNHQISILIKNHDKIYYDLLKNTSTDYIAAKRSLISAFKTSKFGTWIQKPEEMTTFEINICNENN